MLRVRLFSNPVGLAESTRPSLASHLPLLVIVFLNLCDQSIQEHQPAQGPRALHRRTVASVPALPGTGPHGEVPDPEIMDRLEYPVAPADHPKSKSELAEEQTINQAWQSINPGLSEAYMLETFDSKTRARLYQIFNRYRQGETSKESVELEVKREIIISGLEALQLKSPERTEEIEKALEVARTAKNNEALERAGFIFDLLEQELKPRSYP